MDNAEDHPAMSQRVRFKGRVNVDPRRSDLVREGEIVVWVVRGRCEPATYHRLVRNSPDHYQFNVQHLLSADPLAEPLRSHVLAAVEHGVNQAFSDNGEVAFPLDSFDELLDARAYLAEIGELHEGEKLSDVLRRFKHSEPERT